jgi:hypothetical protein
MNLFSFDRERVQPFLTFDFLGTHMIQNKGE